MLVDQVTGLRNFDETVLPVGPARPTTEGVYKIPANNLFKLRHEIEKLNRKAAKLGLDPIVFVEGAEELVVTTDDVTGEKRARAVVHCTVTGTTPRLNGYTFVATLEHLGPEGNIIRAVPGAGIAVPKSYREAAPNCVHCGLIRRRGDTFLLREDATGEFKQIGRNCLADYLRTTTPEMMLRNAEFLCGVADACEESEGGMGSGGFNLMNLAQFIAQVYACVRIDGAFVSRTKARIAEENGDLANQHSTVSRVVTVLFGRSKAANEARAKYAYNEEDFKQAEVIIAWARAELPVMLAKEDSDYIYNLELSLRRDYIGERQFGIAGSVIAVWNNDLVKKANAKRTKEQLANSKHFGQPKERIKNLGVTLLFTYMFETDYGPKWIIKMITDDGNVCVWFSTAGALMHPVTAAAMKAYEEAVGYATRPEPKLVAYGERVLLTATVKDHDTRDGIAQTVLSRCTVQEGEIVAKAKRAKKVKVVEPVPAQDVSL